MCGGGGRGCAPHKEGRNVVQESRKDFLPPSPLRGVRKYWNSIFTKTYYYIISG